MDGRELDLSICMITCNHEKYIHQAIDGILLQQTDFNYELVVGVDYSNDNTLSICMEYALDNPKIKLLTSNVKIGITQNFIRTLLSCNGKYIALCEGDDIWTAPYKSQMQVNFLKKNPEFALIASKVTYIDENGHLIQENSRVSNLGELYKPEINFFDLLEANFVNTLSVCIRSNIIKELARKVLNEKLWFVIDKWFWLNIAMDHKIKLLDEKTAAYRVHPAGISRNSDFMDSRMPQIRHDVIRKFILNHNLYTLNEADLSVLSKSCLNLILFRKLSLKKRLDILWLVFTHPVLMKNSLNFLAESIRKRFRRK
jgi:glycosyltransferase involved in cell wall biosynthesis